MHKHEKNGLMREVAEYEKKGYRTRASVSKMLGCADTTVIKKIGEPDIFLDIGGKKAFLYLLSRVQAYQNRGKCANCED